MARFLHAMAPIIRESPGEVRSGCVGTGTELIPGPVNLHELHGIKGQAGLRQVVHDGKRCRQEPLLPVPFELADDIFHVIFINQEVVFHNRFHIFPFFRTVQDLLLVMERNLGVRDQDGRDKGVGYSALRTEYTLDRKPDHGRVKLNRTPVMAITDEASLLPAGTFNLVELQPIHHTVIPFLGKTIAFFKDNCYHSLVSLTAQRGTAPGAAGRKTGRL